MSFYNSILKRKLCYKTHQIMFMWVLLYCKRKIQFSKSLIYSVKNRLLLGHSWSYRLWISSAFKLWLCFHLLKPLSEEVLFRNETTHYSVFHLIIRVRVLVRMKTLTYYATFIDFAKFLEQGPLINTKWVTRQDTGIKKRKINLFSFLSRKHFFLHFIFLQLKLSEMQFGSWTWGLKVVSLSRIQIPTETGNVSLVKDKLGPFFVG